MNHGNGGWISPVDFTPEVIAQANLYFTFLEFPVAIDQISTFERNYGVTVNVYGLVKVKQNVLKYPHHDVYPLQVAKEE